MKNILLIIALFLSSYVSAQTLQGWRFSPQWQIDMKTVDSLTFSEDGNTMYVNSKYGKAPVSLAVDGINQIKIADKDSLQDLNILYPGLDLGQLLLKNDRIKLFSAALKVTGLIDSLTKYKDNNYNASLYEKYLYPSHSSRLSYTVPDQHLYGFTAFVETDSMLVAKYGINTLEQLYDKACQLYDPVYPEDATAPYHSMNSLTDRRNPLNRFIAYHLLDRTASWDYLTCRGDVSIETALVNPCEWYETMSPHEMIKVEKLTVENYVGAGTKGQLYLNRRYDANYTIEGSMIEKKIENNYGQQAVNGIYYYVDDILAFNTTTRDIVDNCRMRIDISTLFPELMTNNIRGNGDYAGNIPDDEMQKYGRNYYFPEGYLKNVKINSILLYLRPHNNLSCYEGDEMDMFGNYDITFRLPSVPVEGDYQIRLGYVQEPTRGTVQVYFDDNLQGTPLNMAVPINSSSIGADYTKAWSLKTTEEKAAERTLLKDKGYYRGPASVYRLGTGNTHYSFVNQPVTFRIVLCTVHITLGEYHTLRLKNPYDDGSSELMLDYLEMVPKSVYGVTDGVEVEDDL